MSADSMLDNLMRRASQVGWPTDGSRPDSFDRRAVACCAIAYIRAIAGDHPVVRDELGHNTLDQFLEQLIDEIADGQHGG